MAKLEKNTARLILRGISIFGILLGFSFVLSSIGIVLELEEDDLGIRCGLLIVSAALLGMGAYMIYMSYLMFRQRTFATIRLIAVVFAVSLYGMVVELVRSFVATSVTSELPRYIKVIGVFAALIGLYLCVSTCGKLSTKLLEAADIRMNNGDSYER